MHTVEDVINLKVSFQADTWSEISLEPTIKIILSQIRSGNYKVQIEKLRERLGSGDYEYYDNYKKKLPAVTFSATFNQKRINDYLQFYNQVIVIDIDKLNNDQLIRVRDELNNDSYVFSFWRSPSGNGFKGLVSVNYGLDKASVPLEVLHKSAFKKLSNYFAQAYNIELDKSGSDITRLCFLSFDTDLIIKANLEQFSVYKEDILQPAYVTSKSNQNFSLSSSSSSRDALYNPLGRNNQFNRKTMSDIIRYLNKKRLSITYNYEEWCKVAMTISNSFTFDIGIKYFLKLSSRDIEKYTETKCAIFLNNCYETRNGNVNFSSVIYLANQKGYKTKYQRNGVPKVEGLVLSQVSLSSTKS